MQLSEEVLAFMSIANIQVRQQNGTVMAAWIVLNSGIFWAIYLTEGDMNTVEYWQERATVTYSQIVPGN